MKEFVEKLIGRLEELQKINYEAYETAQWNNDKIMYINASNAYANAITEINQLAKEYKHGHFGCNSNGEHEKCDGCGLSGKCSHYNTEWFGVKEEYKSNLSENLTSSKTTITNADKIRAMDDSELAGWISNLVRWSEDGEAILSIWDTSTKSETRIHDSCGDVLEWLQSEV